MLIKYNSFVYVEYPKIFGCSMKLNWVNAWMYKELFFRLFHFLCNHLKEKWKRKYIKIQMKAINISCKEMSYKTPHGKMVATEKQKSNIYWYNYHSF